MRKLRNTLIAFGGLAALAILVATIIPETSQGQGVRNDKDKDVFVVNTTTNPVPVVNQGTAKVMVASPVQIGNAASNPVPVSPQGVTSVEGNVNVVGPVSVQTTPSAPMYSLPAVLPAGSFHRQATIVLPDGDHGISITPPDFVVPPGKSLILQYVSADILMWPNREPAEIPDVRLHLFDFGLNDVDLHFTENLTGGNEWSISQILYGVTFSSGATLPIHFSRTGSFAGQSTLTITLSGTLVPQ